MIEFIEQKPLLGFRLPPLADIHQHVDGAVDPAGRSRSGVGNGMKGTRVPSGRSATASAPRTARPSLSATAIGHWSCGSGVPSGMNSFHVTHHSSLPSTGVRPENSTAASLK